MKDKYHVMNIKRVAKISFLSLVLALHTFALPTVFADISVSYESATTSSDEAQGDISATDCANLSKSLAAAYGCSTSSTAIDGFSGYDGKLEAPDTAAYDPALTKATTARELIQKIVNFALSFLGLVATVIVIYGGVLYVTSRGDETQATEGKKAISYAVIGIVIILGSFAIVNTLLSATGADTSGNGTTGATIAESGAEFDVQSVLEELTNVTSDYISAYKTYNAVTAEVDYLMSLEGPISVDVTESDKTLGGILEYLEGAISGTDDTYEDTYSYIDQSAIDSYLEKIQSGLVKIQGKVDSLSTTYEKSQALYNYLKSGSTTSYLPDFNFISSANAATTSESGCSSTYSFDENREIGLGVTIYDTVVSEIDPTICYQLYYIIEAAKTDYNTTVIDLEERLTTLNDLFDTGDNATSTLQTINDSFETVNTQIADAEDISNVSAASVSSFVKSVDKVYKLVKNVQFVDAHVNASATTGNAPLIVRFDSLGTLDPKVGSVIDENISWDFGDEHSDSENSNTANGPTTNHTFNEPGTYRVKMKALSTENDIAAGIGFVTIKVSPRSSIIKLSATAGGVPTELADFSLFPPVDKETYKVILNEAQSGISFNAGDSTDGDGEALVFYSWDFGDGDVIEGAQEKSQIHSYGEEGTYLLSLTVTDSTGLKDSKYTKIYVGSPAARISVSPESGFVGTKFKFSGSSSSANLGTISNYKWTATLDGNPYTLKNDSGIQIDAEFDQPGIYTVSLTVTDATGGQDTDSVDLLVDSQSPVAKFDYSVPNSTQPGTYVFDGSKSYDPDSKDTISYFWDIEGTEGVDWTIENESSDGSEITVNFLTIGERDVSLTVSDDHEGELQKSAVATATINITSVLDIDLDVGDGTYKLSSTAQVDAEMIAVSKNAKEVEIDYGDGDSEISKSFVSDKVTFNHTFKKSGVFNVKLTALGDNNITNTITRRVYIGSGDSPIAVLNVTTDGNDAGFGDSITGNIKTKFEFDATSSINIDGTSNNLTYSWNFDDQTTSTSSKASHVFKETGDFNVILTVKDSKDPSLSSQTNIKVTIETLAPKISGITAVPASSSLVTPLTVNLNVDASDDDGKIVKVKAWYYDLNNSSVALGESTFSSTTFSLKINTKGEENEEVTYGFAAEVTDDQNNTVNSANVLSESQVPTITVTNGPNKVPTAAFSVDMTSVTIGDEITFSSSSADSDGKIVSYTWDVEGDGFKDNAPQTSPSFKYKYTVAHPSGVAVKLKVEDDGGADSVSEPKTIYVTSNSDAPQAAFLIEVAGKTVTFTDNTTFDSKNGSVYSGIYWDFDTSLDSNGDGVKDNDVEEKDKQNPSHTYPALGAYNVKMTVVDNTGQSDSVTNTVNVMQTLDPVASFTSSVSDKTANFTDKSTTDTANDVSVQSYKWDFDISKDSDGDTIPDNDSDATTKNPTKTYTDYGTYKVSLTIKDTYGKQSTATNTITLASPASALKVSFTAVPTPVSKKITMTGTSGYISFYFNATGGSGDYSYQFDKNIFYDTNKDGDRANDIDYADTKSGSWKTYFDKSYGQIVTKLTVTDNVSGDSAFDTIQITFQGSFGGANLFNATNSELYLFILGALMAALAGTALVYTSKPQK